MAFFAESAKIDSMTGLDKRKEVATQVGSLCGKSTLESRVFDYLMRDTTDKFVSSSTLSNLFWSNPKDAKRLVESVINIIDIKISSTTWKSDKLKLISSGHSSWKIDLIYGNQHTDSGHSSFQWGTDGKLRECSITVLTNLSTLNVRPQFQSHGDWQSPSCLENYKEYRDQIWQVELLKRKSAQNTRNWHVLNYHCSSEIDADYFHIELQKASFSDYLATSKNFDKSCLIPGSTLENSVNLLAIDVLLVTKDDYLVVRRYRDGATEGDKLYVESSLYGFINALMDVDRDKTWQPNANETAFRLCCNLLGFPLATPIRWIGVGKGNRLGTVSIYGLSYIDLTRDQVKEIHRYSVDKQWSESLDFWRFSPPEILAQLERNDRPLMRHHVDTAVGLALATMQPRVKKDRLILRKFAANS